MTDSEPSTFGGLLVRLLPDILALLGLVMTAFVLPAARAWLLERSKTSALARAAAQLEAKLTAAVAEVNARLKPSIGRAAEDGVITDKEAGELRTEGLAIAKELLGPVGLAGLKLAFGLATDSALERFLVGHLEATVERVNVAAAVKGEPIVEAPALNLVPGPQ